MAPARISTSKVGHGRVLGQVDFSLLVRGNQREMQTLSPCKNWLGLEGRGGSWSKAETEGSCWLEGETVGKAGPELGISRWENAEWN